MDLGLNLHIFSTLVGNSHVRMTEFAQTANKSNIK